MPDPGDVIVANMPGAQGMKIRPGIVISSAGYHAQRPDVIAGVVTSNIAAANSLSDCVLADWQAAGLVRPSAFRAYIVTVAQSNCRVIGHVSATDWIAVQACLGAAIDAGEASGQLVE